jgi:hypothetical protein
MDDRQPYGGKAADGGGRMPERAGQGAAPAGEAGEALRVIAHFDTLLVNNVGPVALVRGAAVLAGVIAGAAINGQVIRVASNGDRLPAAERKVGWPTRAIDVGVRAWLERDAAEATTDGVILERLALTMAVALTRRQPAEPEGIETLLDSTAAATSAWSPRSGSISAGRACCAW